MTRPAIHQISTAVLIALSLVAAGCGKDDDGSKPAEQKAVKLPSAEGQFTVLQPGTRYETALFRPKLTITVPEGEWTTPSVETPTGVSVQFGARAPTKQAILAVFHVQGVFDPKKGGRLADDAKPAPADFIDFLATHPRLRATKPVPVELGPLHGRQIDVEVKSATTEQPGECENRSCLPLYTDSGELAQFGIGNRMRYLVLGKGADALVVEMFVNPGKQFETVVPELEKLLKMVEVGS